MAGVAGIVNGTAALGLGETREKGRSDTGRR